VSVNLAAALVRQAHTRPQLMVGTVDDQITLEQALTHAAARATQLLNAGLEPGARVALVAPTSTDYIVTWMACLLARAPVALVNPTYPDELTERMLAPVDPQLTLRDADVRLARSAGQATADGLPGLAAAPLDIASFMHTSGTTGLPKFCAQSHDYFVRLAAAMSGALRLRPDDRVLAPLPLFHINPMGYGIITALLAGADALTVGKFSASRFWTDVVQEQITVLVLHAPPVEILKRATTASDAVGHRVRTMFYADAQFLHQFTIPTAVSGYGSTEAGGVSNLTTWSAAQNIPADASRHGGPARADFDSRVTEDGQIFVRERERGAMFDGYVTLEGVDSARDEDGWFDTGDLGRTDGDDYLVFLERSAESIRVKGEFVPIPFVENHLAAVPALTDYALWKRKGELVDDEVVLYAVAEDIPLAELNAVVAGLPVFMRPQAIARVGSLPRDAAAGKVQRRLLTEQPVLEWIELP
jgi:crotonobetaine/carnitine-CoA ligase